MGFDASMVIGGSTDGTNPDTDTFGVGNAGSTYDIPTGGGTNTGGGGLAEILTNNSNALITALKQTSNAQISQGKTLVDAITSGALLKRVAMKKISDEMAKHGINTKDYMDNKINHLETEKNYIDKKSEHLDYAKNGDSNLKDSQGKTIIPREANAKYKQEKAIETETMNKTDFCSVANDMLNTMDDTGTSLGNGNGSGIGNGVGSSNDDDLDVNIMVSAINKMFNLDNIDFDNLPNNLKEEV